MKQKKYLILAAAAVIFAACSSDDGPEAPEQQEAYTTGEVPVAFDTYVNRGTTRAGKTGNQDLAAIKTENVGFGVFAYYTNADNYDQTFQPNFMYNQHVTWSTDKFIYSPIKYWPNEFGNGALSDDVDKVSFFAYAPFVSVNPSSGKVKTPDPATYSDDNGDATMGIVGMKSNSATGDPMVKYISTFYTDKQVDLTWATTGDDNVAWAKKNTGDQTIDAGKPWLNVEHPSATSVSAASKVSFKFQHSLAALNVTVDTKTNNTTVAAPNEYTKVFIRSVTFEGFDTKGALNLNNVTENTALWYNFDCENELNNGNEVTIKDGRKDGKEGITAATKELAAINPTFVQDKVWASLTATGVTATETNLFAKYNGGTITTPTNATDPIYVIPNGDNLKVTIEYDVLTKDNNLVGKLNDGVTNGSVVKNVITRYITSTSQVGDPTTGSLKLAAGKQYTIKLHLGLNSVEFDADVKAWDTPIAGGADLPHNN